MTRPKWSPADSTLLACAVLVTAIAGLVTWIGSWKLTYATLTRDQGTFQYIAWALQQGQRDYVDIRDFNGPLIHFVHLLYLQWGGADEHVFRVIDGIVNAAFFFAAGALIAELARQRAGEEPGPRAIHRWAWGLAAAVVLSAQYLRYGAWNTAERESYYTLFLLLAVAFQIWAQGAPDQRRAGFVLAGLCSVIPWFGKPTNVLFTALQWVTLACAAPAPLTRRRGVVAFMVGGGLAGAIMLGLLALWGDITAFLRITLLEVPAMYMAIYRRSWWDTVLHLDNWRLVLPAAVSVGVLGLGLLTRRLPARMIVLLVLPVGGILTFILQSKGFAYHLHPVSCGMFLIWLGLAVHVAGRPGMVRTAMALALAAFVGFLGYRRARNSDAYASDWPRAGATAELRAGEAYFKEFWLGSYHAWDFHRAAAFVAANTAPEARVQTYGLDPYFLFLARRLSATPYLFNFELNPEASAKGGSGGVPRAEEQQKFREAAERRQLDLVRRLEARPPEVFALFDNVPFTSPPDAVVELDQQVKPVAAFLHARYREAARIGTVRVWFRRDLAVRHPPAP